MTHGIKRWTQTACIGLCETDETLRISSLPKVLCKMTLCCPKGWTVIDIVAAAMALSPPSLNGLVKV